MCYKISTREQKELEEQFKKEHNGLLFEVKDYQHYYHADGFVRPYLPFTANEEPYVVAPARWKLLPFVVKNDKEAWACANTLNARSEDVFTKFSYKSYIGKTRGLLWVNGFYEPNHPEPKKTVPYYVRAVNHEPFTLGCVYSNWVDKDTGEVTRTFSIITTPPNKLLGQIHNDGQRMPLIITPEDRGKWLGELSKEELTDMMVPLADGYLTGYPVSNLVYKKGIDTNVPEAQEEVKMAGF